MTHVADVQRAVPPTPLPAEHDRNGLAVPAGQQGSPSPKGRAGDPAGLPAGPRRARNTTWIVAGAALVVFSGLGAASIWSSLSRRVEVLAAHDLISEGQVVTQDDLVTVSISAESGVKAISPAQIDELVGQVATGPIDWEPLRQTLANGGPDSARRIGEASGNWQRTAWVRRAMDRPTLVEAGA